MRALLALAAARFYLRHPWQFLLAICGVGLGVAVYVGVDLANDSARRAFALSSTIVLGQTTHRLLPVGGELDEQVLRELIVERGLIRAAPVIEAELRLGSDPARRYTLLGIDPLAEVGFRGFSGLIPGADSDLGTLLATPASVLVPRTLTDRYGLARGIRIDARVDGRPVSIEVAGTVDATTPDGAGEAPFVADIATAQELTGRIGVLDRVDLILDPFQAAALAADPPRGTTLVPASSDVDAFADLTRAFHTNLQALGLLALVVGVFLIYATMSFTIVQRREQLGVLRALGLDRRQVLAGVLAEAGGIAVLATAIGLALGAWLAHGLVELMLRTIGDLYFTAAVSAPPLSLRVFLTGAALGVGATLIAALGPAADAARTPPDAAMQRAALERDMRARSRVAGWAALPALAIAGLLLAYGPADLVTGFAALFFVLIAGALATPMLTAALMRIAERPAERLLGLPGLLAVRGVTASLSRTGVAAAALAVAVAAVIGVGLMIASFRVSLIAWLDTTLAADYYISAGNQSAGPGQAPGFDAATIAALGNLSGVAGLSLSRFLRVPTEHGEIGIRAIAAGPTGWGLDIVDGNPDLALAQLAAGDAVIVSEPLAYRLGLAVGDTILVPTPAGDRAWRVGGIGRDYNTGGGTVVISQAAFERDWGAQQPTTIGVHLHSDPDARAVETALRDLLPGVPVRSTRALRAVSLEIFDRTFTITEVLRILAALVAFLGVLSALLAIQLERVRELAVMRSIGFSPRGLTILVLGQTGLLGLAAGLVAIPLGAALSVLLIQVINRRSFGWSIDFVAAPEPMLGGIALAVAAALLAGIWPALKAARAPLDAALREE
jgi:putative ABC transport system permease protein